LNKLLLKHSFPLYLELLTGVGVAAVGIWLSARLGDQQAASFSLANQVFATLFVFFRVLGAGVGVVLAQNLGAQQAAQAGRITVVAFWTAWLLGLILGLVAFWGSTSITRWFTTDPQLLAEAAQLLRWIAPALVLDAVVAVLAATLRAHLRAKASMWTILPMQVVQLALAMILMPMLGLAGYAIALLASRVFALALFAFHTHRLVFGQPKVSTDQILQALQEIARIGFPAAAENIGYRLSYAVALSAVGAWGMQSVATHGYVSQLNHLVLPIGLAIGLTTEVIVGRLIGAGQFEEASQLAKSALRLGYSLTGLVALIFALAGPWLLRLFTTDPSIIELGVKLLWISVALELGRTFNLIIINALRGASDVLFPVSAGIGSMIFVLAGGSWLLGHVLGLGLIGIWIAYAADEWVRGLLMWWRWKGKAWRRYAHAAHQRFSQ
jgi:Na+-driven multidrug efflux pump